MSTDTNANAAQAETPAQKPVSDREQMRAVLHEVASTRQQVMADPLSGFITPAEAVSARARAGEPGANGEASADIEPGDDQTPDDHHAEHSRQVAAEPKAEEEGEPNAPNLSDLGLSAEELKALKELGHDVSKMSAAGDTEADEEAPDPFEGLTDEERAPYAEYGGNVALMSKQLYHQQQAIKKREEANAELLEYIKQIRSTHEAFRGGRAFDEASARTQIREALLDDGLDESSAVFKDAMEYRVAKARETHQQNLPPDIPEVEQWVERVRAERERAQQLEDQRIEQRWNETRKVAAIGGSDEPLDILHRYVWEEFTSKPTSDGRVLLARAQPALEADIARYLLKAPAVGDKLAAALKVRSSMMAKRRAAVFTPGSEAQSRTSQPAAMPEEKVRRTSPDTQPSNGNVRVSSHYGDPDRATLQEILMAGKAQDDRRRASLFG